MSSIQNTPWKALSNFLRPLLRDFHFFSFLFEIVQKQSIWFLYLNWLSNESKCFLFRGLLFFFNAETVRVVISTEYLRQCKLHVQNKQKKVFHSNSNNWSIMLYCVNKEVCQPLYEALGEYGLIWIQLGSIFQLPSDYINLFI